ncbi:MAG: hypothetical protein ACP5Q4_10145, partial [Candidatus Caldatribacteriaceae bacterium]
FVEKEVETICPSLSVQDLNWPIKLKLISPLHHFSSQDLVLAADCSAFASRNFHERLRGRRVLISCQRVVTTHQIWSLEVILMEVPRCLGLQSLAAQVLRETPTPIPFTLTVLRVDGTVKERQLIHPGEQKAIAKVDGP